MLPICIPAINHMQITWQIIIVSYCCRPVYMVNGTYIVVILDGSTLASMQSYTTYDIQFALCQYTCRINAGVDLFKVRSNLVIKVWKCEILQTIQWNWNALISVCTGYYSDTTEAICDTCTLNISVTIAPYVSIYWHLSIADTSPNPPTHILLSPSIL